MSNANDALNAIKTALDKVNLGDRLKNVGLNTGFTWGSRKLWITIMAVCGLVFLSHGEIQQILADLRVIIMTYLIVTGVEDVAKHMAEAIIKSAAVKAMAKDGLTDDEADKVLTVEEA
jgi:hypothetical protein